MRLLTYSLTGGVVIKLIVQGVKYAVGFQGIVTIYMISSSLKKATILKLIGDYSYDIYLMHNPYIVALGSMVLNKICGIKSYITIVVAVSMGVLLPIVVSHFAIRRISLLSTLMLGTERKKTNGFCRN